MATTLMPWRKEFDMLEPFRTDMEETFSRFFNGNGKSAVWAPRVDVKETEKEIQVKADLPGVDPKDVEIAITDGVLTLRGEKKEEKEEKKSGYHRYERFAGQFYREVSLPAGADADKVTASSSKGVVTITVPKKAEAQPRRIAIQAKD